MATEQLYVRHTAGTTVFFRFYDISQDKRFDFNDNTWQASPVNEKLSAAEQTEMGDADESIFTASVDLSLLNSGASVAQIIVQAMDDLATDEIIGDAEMIVLNSERVVNSNVSQISENAAAADNVEANIGNLDAAITSLNDLSAADVNAEVDTALADYDGPTNAEMEARTLAAADYFDPAVDAVAAVASLNDLSAADVNAEVDIALADYDGPTNAEMVARTIMAADYFDPAVDAVASVTNGVTLADDAITAAKYDESTAFPVKAADSGSTQIARVGADGDTLETLSDQLDAIPTVGDGAIQVNHDTGGADNLAYKTAAGAGIDNATVRAFLKSDYDAGNRSAAYVKGLTETTVDGEWLRDMWLDAATYTFVFEKQGIYGPDTVEATIS